MQETKAKSDTVRLRVWGRNACFTRPEMKVERISYVFDVRENETQLRHKVIDT